MKSAVLGDDRKLLPIWRAILFALTTAFALVPLIGYLSIILFPPPRGEALVFAPDQLAIVELVNFVSALICTAMFAWYEHRRLDSYGLPIDCALRLPTWEGFLIGAIQAGAVAVAMYLLGAMQIQGLALSGAAIAWSALAWLGACVCIGMGEEYLFRGYFLQTLWKAIGFWPAAAVVAVIFAGIHYLLKPGENLWDMVALVSFSLLCCYSLLRTGTLWFAVGLHVAYDFMQLFVIGTANGGQFPIGRLLDASFNGPAWLTGGSLGTEASRLSYPLDFLAFAYLWWRTRSNPPFRAQ